MRSGLGEIAGGLMQPVADPVDVQDHDSDCVHYCAEA